MCPLILSPSIKEKLGTKHQVTETEIKQCFENLCGEYIEETRLQHKTNPPSYWFLAKTNSERLLKVIFTPKDGNLYVKSAFEPNAGEIQLYRTLNPQ